MRLSILWLRRIAGLALFAIGIAYWIRLVGVFPEANWRFDLMSSQWRAASCVLAVLAPVGGVGLWLAASWGTVVWIIVATLEAGMHFALPQIFGGPDAELAVVLATLAAFALLRIAEWWSHRPPGRAG
ncbi:DUF6163 family protein [Aureimonas leprariae]|uniref:DUF6163 family protein n=1 Tax=Plantimonas leprariae TaxID=2615207 RepID=UPI001FEABB01|nr:DUF6163 family protein [Aureimonas leprariae]